jgi:hypothetical protein
MEQMKDLPNNLPREQLMIHAQRTLLKMNGGYCYFKFTCEKCGKRCTLQEPNVLYEQGECCSCGHTGPITEGGYMFSTSRLPTETSQ